MIFKLKDVFDEYSNPIYIIKPIIIDGAAEDFEYVYVNNAFCLFLGISKSELTGHRFKEHFGVGEQVWLEAFVKAASGRKHIFVDSVSNIINRKMYMEIFHIEPNMCGCIIHNYETVSGKAGLYNEKKIHIENNIDALTGFYNRFYINEYLNELSENENVGITYFKINNLREVNAKQGHKKGDELIIRVSSMMRTHYKNSLIFRLDGDEFVIMTESCTEEGFTEMSEKCKKLFAREKLATVGYKYYDSIDNLNSSIEHCKELMNEQKSKVV
jgi:diguanylate cyclase (GGDEF)-like protein